MDSVEQLMACADEWRALADASPRTELFHSWEWVASATEAFAGKDGFRIFVVRKDGRLIGVFPFLARGNSRSLCSHSLVHPGEWAGLLCADDPAEPMAALREHLARTRKRWCVKLAQYHDEAPVLDAWRRFGGDARRRVSIRPGYPTQGVRFDGDWEAYLASRNGRVRKEWRRKQRKLEEAGKVEIRTYAATDEVDQGLADFFSIEQRSWKEDRGTSLATGRGQKAFHTFLGRRAAARGWLRLHVLYLDGRPIAHLFAVVFRGQCFALSTSYDVQWAHLSAGIVVTLHALRAAAEEGVRRVDLLGASQRWKQEVGNEITECVNVSVSDPGCLRCRGSDFIADTVKPLVRERFPKLVEWKKDAEEALGEMKGRVRRWRRGASPGAGGEGASEDR